MWLTKYTTSSTYFAYNRTEVGLCPARTLLECVLSQTEVLEARKAKPKKKTQRIVCDFAFHVYYYVCVSHMYIIRGPLCYVKKSALFKALARHTENKPHRTLNRTKYSQSLEYTFLRVFFSWPGGFLKKAY